MIENLRKYTGLTVVVIVLLFISFLFLDTSSMRSGGGGGAFIRVADRDYSGQEFSTLGASSFELVRGLAQTGDFQLFEFLMQMTHRAVNQDDAPESFFVSRMILRQAKEDYGIYPGSEEISNYIRSMRAFAGEDGKFDQAKYNQLVEKGIGRFGMTEKDLTELISDIIVSQKLFEVIGTGLTADRDMVAKSLALNNQKISGHLGILSIDPFEEKISPTEEELKKYWDTQQGVFTTAPKRKFTYVLVTPIMPSDEVEEPAALPENPNATEDEKKAAAKARDEEKAKRVAAVAEERRKAQIDADGKVAAFFDQLMDQQGAGLEELAKEYTWTPQTTELFTKDAAPADLALTLRASSEGGAAVDQLFAIKKTADPFSLISPAIAVGENQWLIARLDGEEPSRDKTYDEARAELRAQYIAEKASEALKAAAQDAIKKITPEITAGKSFADAAKTAGIEKIHAFSGIEQTTTVDGETQPQNLFTSIRTTDVGALLAEPIIESDRAFVIAVDKREVTKDPSSAARIDSEVQSQASNFQQNAYISWLTSRIEAANVKRLNRKE
ncbi:MAG: hypothetical protein EAZ42_05765 [Verrucomicrobia bacterium]|nr:MAG: hypothetical protein EAZ42_05765 [Verrucomicrobiota bacterium]